MWAVSLLLGIAIAYCIAAGAASGAATVASGAAQGAAQNPRTDGVSMSIDRMLRPPKPDPANPARVENPRAEIGRVLSVNALTRGQISNEDRDYVASIVASEARIPPEEARRRVDSGIEQAKQAADTARKIAGGLAFLIGALSILSAGAAYWAATAGGRERDENVWR